jgi:hypothetical protein
MTKFSGTDRTAGSFRGFGYPPQVSSATDGATAPAAIEVTRKEPKASRATKIGRRKLPSAAPVAVTEDGGTEHARTGTGENVPAEVAQLRSTLDGLRHVKVGDDARQQLQQVALVRAGRRALNEAAADADSAGTQALLDLQTGAGDPAALVEVFVAAEARLQALKTAQSSYPAYAQAVPPALLADVEVAVGQLRSALPTVDPPLIVASLAAWRERVDRRSVQLGATAHASTPPTPLPPRPTDLEQAAIEAWEAWTQGSRAVAAQVRVIADTAAALGPDVDAALNVLRAVDQVLDEQVPQVARRRPAVRDLVRRADAQRNGMEIGHE